MSDVTNIDIVMPVPGSWWSDCFIPLNAIPVKLPTIQDTARRHPRAVTLESTKVFPLKADDSVSQSLHRKSSPSRVQTDHVVDTAKPP